MRYLLATLVLMFIGLAFALWNDVKHPIVCTESVRVEKILKVSYRDALIQLANGQKVWISQGNVEPDDLYCTKHEKK